MYKVLIADDETIIRSELAKAFPWSDYSMEVVALAKNGMEAYAQVEALHPDVCLLDINMPLLNGLELIEKIQQFDPHILCVVISGYDEFKYAQKALKLGVYEYVLKPIDEEPFLDMLGTIRDKLNRQHKDRQIESISSVLLEDNREVLRNEFFTRWLRGEKSEPEVAQGLSYFGVNLPKDAGLVLVKISRLLGAAESGQEKSRLIERAKQALTEYFKDKTVYCPIELQSDRVVLILDAGHGVEWSHLERTLEQFLAEKAEIHVKIAKTLISNGALGVPEAFRAAEQVMKTELAYLPLVKKIKQYVEKNYENSQLRLQTIADENQISISYLSKIFKQETGDAFIDYLINFRIMKSLELLDRTAMKICDIAENVGYSSQHYYCEAFKKVMGMSPTEYRKRGND